MPHYRDKDLSKTIGARIVLARENIKMSQVVLAGKLQITPQQLYKYEVGKNRISAVMLYGIAQISGRGISGFFKETRYV